MKCFRQQIKYGRIKKYLKCVNQRAEKNIGMPIFMLKIQLKISFVHSFQCKISDKNDIFFRRKYNIEQELIYRGKCVLVMIVSYILTDQKIREQALQQT